MLLWNNVSKFRLGHLLSAPVQRRNLFESARSALFFALKKQYKHAKLLIRFTFANLHVKQFLTLSTQPILRYKLTL